jgi:antirestriction protein ArdC
MKVEQAKQIASNAIEQLRRALEAGHSERLKEYLAAMARFRRYSWGNVMLIASQKPNATHVAGFHAWHKLGRFVKKGEKGILILAPIVRKKAENNGEGEADESSVAVGFRAAYVFDISQTDGHPLPEIASVTGDPREYRDRLAKFVGEQGIALEYSDEIAPARGTSEGGKITLAGGQR